MSHRCVSLFVRVWALDVQGELVPSKIFNPPFPVLKAGHSVSYYYICDVCREWVNEVGFFLNIPVWIVCYAHGFHPKDAEKGKATTTTQQKGKATQHNSPETVIFQRKINCLGWDSNPQPSCTWSRFLSPSPNSSTLYTLSIHRV